MEGESFSGMGNGAGGGGHHQQVVDGKLIQTFHKSFVQVQSILDQNRMLISEINQNHESRAPDSLTRNVGLIRELNNNIRRVVGLYADLSASFAHRGGMDGASSEGDSSGTLRSPTPPPPASPLPDRSASGLASKLGRLLASSWMQLARQDQDVSY